MGENERELPTQLDLARIYADLIDTGMFDNYDAKINDRTLELERRKDDTYWGIDLPSVAADKMHKIVRENNDRNYCMRDGGTIRIF